MRTYQEFVRPGGRGDGGRDGPHRALGGGPPSRDAPSWAPQSGSRTPQVEHGAGSRTPAWMSNSGSRTPAWMAGGDGGRTPAYPAGGKTPAWGMDGNRTSYAGNRTPAYVSALSINAHWCLLLIKLALVGTPPPAPPMLGTPIVTPGTPALKPLAVPTSTHSWTRLPHRHTPRARPARTTLRLPNSTHRHTSRRSVLLLPETRCRHLRRARCLHRLQDP